METYDNYDAKKRARSSAQITVDRIKATRPDSYGELAYLLWDQAPGWAMQLQQSLERYNPYTLKAGKQDA